MKRLIYAILILILPLSLFAAAENEKSSADAERSLTLYCYDAFSSEWGSGPTLIPLFEKKTGIAVNVVSCGEPPQMLSRTINEGDRCPADVVMGINDFSADIAYKAGIFAPYESPEKRNLKKEVLFDSEKRLLPFDYGALAFVYDTESGIPEPRSLEDLTDPIYRNKFILIDPRTSIEGLALLFWSVEVYGEDGYLNWWKRAADNALIIADGWTSAYGLFTEGEAPIVLSYTTSPVYHVLSENSTRYRALVFDQGHPLLIESLGIMRTSSHRAEAEAFVDFILSEGQYEAAITNSMYPANTEVELPEAYAYAPLPEKLLVIRPEEVSRKLERWTEEWTKAIMK
ncbi:MAG: thiamine ABC transporter substrate-binding protein [Spirochaetales bacterium]|nr:thiamine ABC transporter substrate-binding protein [Spirochaetales bacterium]